MFTEGIAGAFVCVVLCLHCKLKLLQVLFDKCLQFTVLSFLSIFVNRNQDVDASQQEFTQFY